MAVKGFQFHVLDNMVAFHQGLREKSDVSESMNEEQVTMDQLVPTLAATLKSKYNVDPCGVLTRMTTFTPDQIEEMKLSNETQWDVDPMTAELICKNS